MRELSNWLETDHNVSILNELNEKFPEFEQILGLTYAAMNGDFQDISSRLEQHDYECEFEKQIDEMIKVHIEEQKIALEFQKERMGLLQEYVDHILLKDFSKCESLFPGSADLKTRHKSRVYFLNDKIRLFFSC